MCAHVYTTIINHCDILRDRLTLSDFTTKRTVFVRGEGFYQVRVADTQHCEKGNG